MSIANSIPVSRSGRLVNDEENSFWDWTLEGCELTTTSGKLGKSGRTTSKTSPRAEKAADDLDKSHLKKLREGFVQRAADNPGPVVVQLSLSRAHTGFQAFDVCEATGRVAMSRHVGDGGKACEVVLFDAELGTIDRVIPLDEFDLRSVRFHGNGLIVQADDRVTRLDLESGTMEPIGAKGVFKHFEFDLVGDRLLYSRAGSNGPVIVLEDLGSGETLLELDAREQEYVANHRANHVGCVSLSGRYVAIGRRKSEIEVFDLENGTARVLTGDFEFPAKLAFHPSDRWLAFTEHYGQWRLRLWSLDTDSEDDRITSVEYTFPDGRPRPDCECHDFGFDPTGRHLAIRDRDWIRILDFETTEPVLRIEQRHVVRHFIFRYTADGRIVTRTDSGVLTVFRLS